ncbi:MAG: phospho-sugar mutase [Clostridiales bacterium]|nr:phospho-sugar mutase [Clostridiales bacterium]
MNYKEEYTRWLANTDGEIRDELLRMDSAEMEDAFYRDLAFGTGGLRGILGAGTNRMNVHVVGKATQGLANYLLETEQTPSVVIGYDSRHKSGEFAKTAAGIFAANGIQVHLWPRLLPVPTVSFAVRELGASAGVMITASHNPSRYNGYKVYGRDGCQITTEAAEAILRRIDALNIFEDVPAPAFEDGVKSGRIQFIPESVLTHFIGKVKEQSVLFGDAVDREVRIVYSPLNGTGLIPVIRALEESGFSGITVVEEQRNPDGDFPTCPYPNPEIREAMELGLRDCARTGADLLLATDPDCDRCGIAVKGKQGYRLLTGNEVGLLLLDYICAQRTKHQKMPPHPVFVKTIVTMDMAEKIAEHYGVETVNVLTGFKFIGEVIGRMEDEHSFIFGFEESYGYLTGSYVRDKDAVDAAFMICEMFAYYKTRGISLTQRLEEIYEQYGYCMNTLHSYEFPGSSGMKKMAGLMESFRKNGPGIPGLTWTGTEDYSSGINGLPKADVLKFRFAAGEKQGSIVVRPSGTEPKLKIYISVTAAGAPEAEQLESRITAELEKEIRG